MIENRNNVVLAGFVRYCEEHPQERFWQALRNWAGVYFIIASRECPVNMSEQDTFYWEGRNK